MGSNVLSTALGILLVCLAGCAEKEKTELPAEVENVRDLRALHTAMVKYLADHDQVWPQLPVTEGADEAAYWGCWKSVLAPYGGEDEDWVDSGRSDDLHSNYTASNFDSTPGNAMKWPGQPWFAEVGTAKEPTDEIFLVFPSGEVISMSESTRRAKAEGRFIDGTESGN